MTRPPQPTRHIHTTSNGRIIEITTRPSHKPQLLAGEAYDDTLDMLDSLIVALKQIADDELLPCVSTSLALPSGKELWLSVSSKGNAMAIETPAR